jgi:polysaccharide export outer membrane protein
MHDTVQTTASPALRDRDRCFCRTPPYRRVALLFCLSLTLASSVGCLSMHQNHYFAGEMPANLVASTNQNPQLIDFTRLSSGASDSDQIAAEDLLQVSIAANLSSRDVFSFPARVRKDGQCDLAMVGLLPLAGMSLEEAEVTVAQASIQRELYRAPHVTVSMKKKKEIGVLVVGAVEDPGFKRIPASEADLLSVLFHAGGLSKDAGPQVDITNARTSDEIKQEAIAAAQHGEAAVNQVGYSPRLAPRSVEVNLIKAAASGGDQFFVGDGGVVMVEKLDPKALYVMGLVRKSGRYEFPTNQDLYLLDAVALAGYTSSQVADKVYIIRKLPDMSQPSVVQASLRRARHEEAHNVRLAPGDVVSVEHTPATVVLEVLNMVRIGVSGSLNQVLGF